MVVNRKKLRNRIFKFSFSFVIAALALVLGLSVSSNAKAVTYTPTPVSSNPFLFTYNSSEFNVTIMPMVNRGVVKDSPILSNSTLTYTSLSFDTSHNQRTNLITSRANYENTYLKQVYNLNYFSTTYPNYFGSYFSSKWLYFEQDDLDFTNNTSIFNHIRLNIYSNNEGFMMSDFDGNISDRYDDFDDNIYLFSLIKNEMLYTNVTGTIQSSHFTDFYPNNAFGINSDGVINTHLPFLNPSGSYFSDYLVNGLTIDFYYKNWLGYSQYNNFVGILSNFYLYDYPGDLPTLYISTTLDYVPITFNWDEDSYTNGFNDGYSIGYSDGSSSGYANGYNDGVSSVDTNTYYDNGYDNGYSAGQNSVDVSAIQTQSYSDGYNAGILNSSHDYGIKDLLYSIFDIPINVLSNLFSFTIFGSNVWAIIVSLLTILVVIWIVSKVMGIVNGGNSGGGKK